jgi:hypothetical protein
MRRLRLGLFLVAFAAWTATFVLAAFARRCTDARGHACGQNWAAGAVDTLLWVATAITVAAALVGIAYAVFELVRSWRTRGQTP